MTRNIQLKRRSVVAAATAMTTLMMVGIGATSAQADDPDDTNSVVVDGTTYGPEDGVEVTLDSIPLTPGEGPVGLEWSGGTKAGGPHTDAVWGSSYAISTEIAYVVYNGTAKAAGNVYSGQRIIKVCIWYSQPGRANSATVCSSAHDTGSSWTSGSEVSVAFVDNLSDNWPHSVFNIQTTRINPNVY